MNENTLGFGAGLLSGHTFPGELIPELGTQSSSGLLDLMEQRRPSSSAFPFQDLVDERTPSASFIFPSSRQDPGLNSFNTTPGQSISQRSFFLNPNTYPIDQFTGQPPGQSHSGNAAFNSPPIPTEQRALLWGVDSHDGQLFQLSDYEQTNPEIVDFGNLFTSSGQKTFQLKRVSAFTIDADNRSAYIAVNRKTGPLKSPWIGKIDLTNVQEGGPNEVR